MQCRCCMHNVEEERTRCDVCGFPMGYNRSDGVDDIAKQFREKWLNGVSVDVKFYYYEQNSFGELVEQKSEYITVADALSLTYREVVWFADEFNPPDVDRDITLEVRVNFQTGSVEQTLTAGLDNVSKCVKLGLYLDEGFSARLAVGTQESYVLSEGVSLMERAEE